MSQSKNVVKCISWYCYIFSPLGPYTERKIKVTSYSSPYWLVLDNDVSLEPSIYSDEKPSCPIKAELLPALS